MLALYRCGRQAEALEAYRQVRATVVEEIGVEPGPELQRLHEAILRQEPSLDVDPAVTDLPRELDAAAAPPLVGRDGELERLRALWRRAAAGTGALVTLAGGYGMGKTRLAAELASAAHRDGAAVLYAAGTGPPDVALAAIARARDAQRPALLVIDDADRAPTAVRAALRDLELDRVPALVLATGLQAAALGAAGAARVDRARGARRRRRGGDRRPVRAGRSRRPGRCPAGGEWRRPAPCPRGGRRVGAPGGHAPRRRGGGPGRGGPQRGARARGRAGGRRRRAAVGPRARRARAARRRRALVVCPYKGLAAFDADDADYFFGRERLVAELVAHVVGAPLLAVVGPSGSGKSSVVRAGLLPALAGGVLPGSENWTQALIRPGRASAARAAPGHAAARPRAPRRARRRPVRGAVHRLPGRGGARGVRRRARALRALGRRRRGARRARGLLRPLRRLPRAGAAARREPRARRPDGARRAAASDRAARAASRPDASSPSSSRRCSPMSRASRARCRCCRRRCSSCGAGATAAAARWPRTRAAAGSRAPWRGSPRMRSSASSPTQQAIARELLLRLADEGESGAIVRRRVAARRARRRADRRRRRALVERRLLTAADGAVEVAHEALLREWPRLRAWLDEDAEGRRLHRRLEVDARAWDADARDPGELYRGARLASALDWARGARSRAQRGPSAAFLDAGRAAAGRAQRRLRLVLAGVASLLVAGGDRGPGRARPARRGARGGDDRRRAAPRGPGAHGRRARPFAAARPPGRRARRLAADARQPARGAAQEPGGDRRAAQRRRAGERARPQP